LPGVIAVGDRIKILNTSANKAFKFAVGSINIYTFDKDLPTSTYAGRPLAARRKGDTICTLYEKPRAQVGDGSWITRLVIDNCSVHEAAAAGWEDVPAIYAAIASGNLEEVKRLAEAGHLSRDIEGARPTSLFYALTKKQEAIARYLVETGADVNKPFEGV